MKLKQIPEDFVVEEIIKLNVKKSGDYTYFYLIKKNWTTVHAIKEIAMQCRVSFKRFKFAGNKDKQAITRQAVSAFRIPPEVLENVKLKDIQIEVIGFGETPLSLGTLKGNRFEIILRDLTKKDCALITANSKLITRRGFPNYFGEQRFGGGTSKLRFAAPRQAPLGSGNTALVGREIIRGYFKNAAFYLLTYSEDSNKDAKAARKFAEKNFGSWNLILEKWPQFLSLEKAVLNHLVQLPNDFAGALRKVPKPIRRMYVHAYQSYLWNTALENLGTTIKNKKYSVPGFKTKSGSDKFSKIIKELLEKDSLTLDSFRCARMPELASEGTTRAAIVKPKKLKLGKLEKDELNSKKLKLKISFELLKGVYATELVRQLLRSSEEGNHGTAKN